MSLFRTDGSALLVDAFSRSRTAWMAALTVVASTHGQPIQPDEENPRY